MADLNLGAIVSAVQKNCHISDAQYARDLTLCTFLLKMRELYRWENDIPLTRDMPKAEVGDWMNERERLWETMEEADFVPLPLPGATLDPFEVDAANRDLTDLGLVYSGGFGRSCKPHFFLGSLERQEDRAGFRIFVSGCEFARDLDAPPGMLLDRTIFVRTEALKRWLWEKYEEWRWSRRNEAMGRALTAYGFDRDADAALAAMTREETESVILHELGEARVGEALGEAWPALLAAVMGSRAEIVARAVRDLYADCLSTLPGLLERGNPAALHFHMANFTGMRRLLFPELALDYQEWLASGDPTGLRETTQRGLARWASTAEAFLAQHRQHGEAVGGAIEAWLARAAPAH
ncbi:MAG: Sfum_1244 family protein [Pseudomonadota bacterium]